MSEGIGKAYTVIEGDVSEILPGLEPGSFDAVLCDPPYGLGFMGKAWDHGVPSRDVWKLVEQTLRPGANLLAFGGTRTFHRLACAIEDAGLEIRDTLCWLYGQGFPKSMDVSKAIDRAAGARRRIVGSKLGAPGYSTAPGQGASVYGDGIGGTGDGLRESDVTAPATPEAARFAGYGTTLKPAFEPVILAMKPTDGTFVENALEHGLAGINVDGCRIRSGDPGGDDREGEASAERRYGFRGRTDKFTMTPGPRGGSVNGRWPANVLLSHLPECREVGTRRVRTGTACMDSSAGKAKPRAVAAQPRLEIGGKRGHAGEDGREEVPVFECAPGCPVAMLDHQTGDLETSALSAEQQARGGFAGSVNCYGDAERGGSRDFAASRGGASRFFYCAKARTAEREAGLERSEQRAGGARNHHPTVKPIELCRYLATLILPPPRADGRPRRLLVPFSGSGSEMIGTRPDLISPAALVCAAVAETPAIVRLRFEPVTLGSLPACMAPEPPPARLPRPRPPRQLARGRRSAGPATRQPRIPLKGRQRPW